MERTGSRARAAAPRAAAPAAEDTPLVGVDWDRVSGTGMSVRDQMLLAQVRREPRR